MAEAGVWRGAWVRKGWTVMMVGVQESEIFIEKIKDFVVYDLSF